MAERLPISDQDVTEIVRLLGEVAGMTEPLVERRRRLMTGLAELVGADVWMWVASRGVAAGAPVPLYFLDGGWVDDAQRTAVWHANTQPELLAAVATGLRAGRHDTLRFDAAHPGWGDGALHRRHVQPTGLEHVMLSIYPLDRDCSSGVGMHRLRGRPPYTPREEAIVHLVVSQVDWLHRAGANVPANTDALTELTPRQREVLIHLLGGDSRKQIARKLKLSEHTVADHVKVLHRVIGVCSRGELLAKFIGRE